MNTWGARLGAWRIARGLTQAALAKRARLPQPAVSGAERGTRDISLRTLCRIADALAVSPGTLLDRDPPRLALDRHRIDAVARAVISGHRALPRDLRLLADACAGATRPTLEACGIRPALRGRRTGARALRLAEFRFGRPVVEDILNRIDRFAGAAAG